MPRSAVFLAMRSAWHRKERAILMPRLNSAMRGDVARHMVTKTVRFPNSIPR